LVRLAASKWVKVYAWYPVTTVFGKRIWLTHVYCRYCKGLNFSGASGMYVKSYYEYATVLDLLQIQ
jgi:hypothetical protein